MMSYKAEVTLNEKDTLTDLLAVEKSLLKLYAFAVSEGCSQGFRNVVKRHLSDIITDQMEVFLLMTELGYYKVESAPDDQTDKLKQTFSEEKSALS